MIQFPDGPPRTRAELFERMRAVIAHGTYTMPEGSRYNGSGAPGMFLEDLLGTTAGGHDIPDALGWELKWHSDRTSLVTLFHKEPDGPEAIMRYMVRRYGRRDAQGRLSFRHTIKGRSDRFRVDTDTGQVIVRPLKGNGPVPYWTHEELVAAAGAKLRRLLLVKGVRQKRSVRFLHADAYQTFHLADFFYEMIRGSIAVDFDCRESKTGSDGLRNHGTKFRIPPAFICRLYLKKDRL